MFGRVKIVYDHSIWEPLKMILKSAIISEDETQSVFVLIKGLFSIQANYLKNRLM